MTLIISNMYDIVFAATNAVIIINAYIYKIVGSVKFFYNALITKSICLY